ncbi:hypothetical protein DOY81_007653 [Sarcophaga bullata]|nr:hypothetical protein DOY81_007653 [Sarcophaga bullata]
MKLYQLTIALLLCMWHCEQAAMADSTAEADDRLEHKIKELQNFNNFLRQKTDNIENILDETMNISTDLAKKVNNRLQQIKEMQKSLKEINQKIDNKLDIIQKNAIPENLLTDVANNPDNIKKLLKEINLEQHVRTITPVKNAIVPQIDAKLSNITTTCAVPENILTEVIKNQNYIKTRLQNINLDKHTQTITNTISNKLAIVSQMDAKLSSIDKNTIAKGDHLAYHSKIKKYFDKIDEKC